MVCSVYVGSQRSPLLPTSYHMEFALALVISVEIIFYYRIHVRWRHMKLLIQISFSVYAVLLIIFLIFSGDLFKT